MFVFWMCVGSQCTLTLAFNNIKVSGNSVSDILNHTTVAPQDVTIFEVVNGLLTDADTFQANLFLQTCIKLDSVTISADVDFENKTLGPYFFGVSCSTFEIKSTNCHKLLKNTFVGSTVKKMIIDSVKSISSETFKNCKITEISANSLVTIPEVAFMGSNMVSGSFKNVQMIGDYAFDSCIQLEGITFGDVTAIGSYAFCDCEKLANIGGTINSALELGEGAFYNCQSLTSFNTKELTTISENAFYNCLSLDHMDLDNAVSINASAFYGCYGLTEITLPKLEILGEKAFMFCISVTTISLPKLSYMQSECCANMADLVNVNIPNVKVMKVGCFQNCYSIETLNLSVNEIGEECFRYCRSLHTIIMDQLEVVESTNFFGCAALRYVYAANLKNITDGLFSNLDIFEFHSESLTSITSHCFAGCRRLQTMDIPNVEYISDYGFMNISCTNEINLSKVTYIGDSSFQFGGSIHLRLGPLDRVGAYAFASVKDLNFEFTSCKSLTAIEYGEWSFYNTSIKMTKINTTSIEVLSGGFEWNDTTVSFPNLYTAKDKAFKDLPNLVCLNLSNLVECYSCLACNCSKLSRVITPKLEYVLQGELFLGSNSITNLTFPALRESDQSAFAGMERLVTAEFKSFRYIPSNCFLECIRLEYVKLSDICAEVSDLAFYGCVSLKGINNRDYLELSTLDYIGISTFYNCTSITTVNMSISEIKDHCFYGCSSLTTLHINCADDSSGVIQECAFEFCTSLANISWPNINTIMRRAFRNCQALEIANFSRLTKLEGDEHFFNCHSLKALLFPVLQTVDSTCSMMFGRCTSLEVVYLSETPPKTFHSSVFLNTGRAMVEVGDVEVVDITLCISDDTQYTNYQGQPNEAGCDESRWMYLYAKKHPNYYDICILTGEKSWWDQNQTTFLAVSCSVLAGIMIVIGVFVWMHFQKQQKYIREEQRKKDLARMILDDFG